MSDEKGGGGELTTTKSIDLETITLSNFHNELAHTCTPSGKQEQITAFQSTQLLQKEPSYNTNGFREQQLNTKNMNFKLKSKTLRAL